MSPTTTTPPRRPIPADDDLGPWPERRPTVGTGVAVVVLLLALVAVSILL